MKWDLIINVNTAHAHTPQIKVLIQAIIKAASPYFKEIDDSDVSTRVQNKNNLWTL